MSTNLEMNLDMNSTMKHPQQRKTPDNRAGRSLAALCAILLLATGLAGPAHAAGEAPAKSGPGAPVFTPGDPAYKGLSNAQTNVSANANAPAGAAANLTAMVNQPPTISWTTANNTIVTAPASFALSVNAADPDGSISKVDYYNGGTLIGSSTSAPFGFSWGNVAAGQYTLTAVATDNLGMSTTSSAITVIANVPPSVSLNPPTGPLYSPAGITLTANASDTDGSISKVDYYTGNTLIGSATASPWSVSWNNVPAGNYSLTAKATDNDGASTTSSVVAVSVLLTPSSTVLNATTPAIVGQATTITASVSGYNPSGTVTFMDGATAIGSASLSAGSNTVTLNYTFTTAGNHSLTVSYAGDARNSGSSSTPVNVTVNSGVAQAYYIHTDQLDTPRQITDTSGNIVWQWGNSDPFGNNPPNENPSGQGTFTCNLRYPGQYFDLETGLFYNHQRDGYNSATGAYTQSDPIGLRGGINTYTYVEGNPLSKTDPRGLSVTVAGRVTLACLLNPVCRASARAAAVAVGAAAGKMCSDGIDKVRNWMSQEEASSGDKPASTPTGQSGSPMDVPKGTNEDATIDGRDFSGHSLDQMQGRGATPTLVNDAIDNGTSRPDKQYPDIRVEHTSQDGRVVVITEGGRVVTVITK